MDHSIIYTMILIAGIAAISTFIIVKLVSSPFHYPYFKYDLDVSGKRKPKKEDLIDEFLIKGNFPLVQFHNDQVIRSWKADCREKIEHCIIKEYRKKQFLECVKEDANAFQFRIVRTQTRYRQKHYIRTSYKVEQQVDQFVCSYLWLQRRNELLKSIQYACPLSKYISNDQRKLMTRELREQIMRRDNYTCRICGKYMPDEVGLQIDHIVPVSKGGKSVPTNLRVLCSKCNGRKSSNIW